MLLQYMPITDRIPVEQNSPLHYMEICLPVHCRPTSHTPCLINVEVTCHVCVVCVCVCVCVFENLRNQVDMIVFSDFSLLSFLNIDWRCFKHVAWSFF